MLLKRSVTSSIAYTLICIVILSVLSTGLALCTVVSSLSDAEAVNIAGSLRMQSYRLAYEITIGSSELTSYLQQYEHSLYAPALAKLNSFYVPSPLQYEYQSLLSRWQLLAAEIQQGNYSLYLQQVAQYVAQIDNFVLAVQQFSELKLWAAGAISIISFITTLLLVFFAIKFIRRQVVDPLNQMVKASYYIQQGHFDIPELALPSKNELGVLSNALHGMASELGKVYHSLEDTVEQKTRELTKANHILGILYDCSQILNSPQLNEKHIIKMLSIVRESEAMTAICFELKDKNQGLRVLNDGVPDEQLPWQSLTIEHEYQQFNRLSWQSTYPHNPSEQLLKNVINMLNRGLSFQYAEKQRLQLLLVEERATIARELHDSLAQSLSFLRIQLTLLKRELPNQLFSAQALINNFDQALSTAYRQLRELLATFRLTIQEANLKEALDQLVVSLQTQTETRIHLYCRLDSQALNAQQQVHALQIIREAVINAIKHANAHNIYITCDYTEERQILFTIADDGSGISDLNEPEGHYGLNIMSERANRLNGQLNITHRAEGGTQVHLVFPIE